jgi:Zn-dependent peptidase ImmA (M78 family)/transcriptional regulator with XRE-family HTH domain
MGKSILAHVNHKVLSWARSSLGLDKRVAARKLGISPLVLERWEDGTEHPTIAKLKKIADVYKRPLAIFYLPTVPESLDPIPDFRRLPQSKGNSLSPDAMLQIRRLYEKQRIAVELARSSGAFDWNFIGSVRLDDEHPERVGRDVRNMLGVGDGNWGSDYEAFNAWRRAVESLGVMVFQIVRIAIDELRGFSIASDEYPAIALNRKDAPRPRIFTLIHEFCHILLGESGVCDISELNGYQNTNHSRHIEEFCNHAAGAALIPTRSLLQTSVVISHGDSPRWHPSELFELANQFKVSQEAILRRLLILEKTSHKFYEEWRANYSPPKISKGGAPEKPFEKVVRTQGTNYVGLVLNALQNNTITATRASDYLEMKTQYLADLERVFQGERRVSRP